jgi:hypothetical protein
MRPLPKPVAVVLEHLKQMLPPVGKEPKKRLVPEKVFRGLY